MFPSFLFILASTVCKFLQYLTSTLTQGGKGGHLFRLTCSIVLREGGTLQQISLACVRSAHSVWATLGLPALMACVLSWYTLLRLQVALEGNCLRWAWVVYTSQVYATQVHVLWYSTKAQTQLGLSFVPFPGLSSSSDKVLAEHTLPRWGCGSYHLPSPSCSVSWVCSGSAISGVLCVSSGELISGCDPPGGCQPSKIPRRLG